MENVKWYALNCVSNREKDIAEKIRKKISIENLDGWVSEVIVPVEKILVNNKSRQNVRDKVSMPGYVLIHADFSNGELLEAIRSVDGFIGFITDTGIRKKGKPMPMRNSEVSRFIELRKTENENPKWKFEVGDNVKMLSGAFTSFQGTVSDINKGKETLNILVNIFGRETSVELPMKDAEKV